MIKPIEKVTVGRSLKYFYNGIVFDSKEEVYVYWWLQELMDRDIIFMIVHQPDSWTLSHPLDVNVLKQLKAGPSVKSKTILREHSYTPDFSVSVTEKGMGLMFFDLQGVSLEDSLYVTPSSSNEIALIEVKPSFDSNNMTREFKINQKWMMSDKEAFINLVIPDDLFAKTFTPERYLFMDGATGLKSKPRKLKHAPKNVQDFLYERSRLAMLLHL